MRPPFLHYKLTGTVRKGMTIQWNLDKLMRDRGITTRELARMTRFHPDSVSRMRSRKTFTRIDHKTLSALCNALDCTPGELLTLKAEP